MTKHFLTFLVFPANAPILDWLLYGQVTLASVPPRL